MEHVSLSLSHLPVALGMQLEQLSLSHPLSSCIFPTGGDGVHRVDGAEPPGLPHLCRIVACSLFLTPSVFLWFSLSLTYLSACSMEHLALSHMPLSMQHGGPIYFSHHLPLYSYISSSLSLSLLCLSACSMGHVFPEGYCISDSFSLISISLSLYLSFPLEFQKSLSLPLLLSASVHWLFSSLSQDHLEEEEEEEEEEEGHALEAE